MALDKLTELMRVGGKPVLEAHGFTRVKRDRNFVRRTATGDVLVVSFDNGGTVPRSTAAQIGAGYSPRAHLEWTKHLGSKPDFVPYWTMTLFNWRVNVPAAASYAPERGEPYDKWWALGDRTRESAEILASVLADDVVPQLTALESLETQLAVIAGPRGKITADSGDWGPVFALLGRAPRKDVEAAIDAIAGDEMFGEANDRFRSWALAQLDVVYGP